MPISDEKALKKHIKSDEASSVYLVIGDEDYLKKHYTELLIKKNVAEDFESLNFRKFEGKNLDLKDVYEEAELMPMMSEKRMILVEDFKLEGMTEKEIKAFSDFFMNPPEFSSVIFFQKSADYTLKKAKKAGEIIEKFGTVCLLNKRTGSELLKPLISSAAKQGCVLSNDGAKYLVSVAGDDFNTLINELSKVCNYCGEGEITRAHIDAVAIKTDDAKIYYLTKALTAKDFDKAYEVLHSLLRQKIEPEYIFGTIVSSYADMYRAKVSLSCGEKAEALSEAYNYRNTAFRLTNAARDSSKLSLATIRSCIEELSKADMKLKGSREEPVAVLEQLMVKLFLVTNGEKV